MLALETLVSSNNENAHLGEDSDKQVSVKE